MSTTVEQVLGTLQQLQAQLQTLEQSRLGDRSALEEEIKGRRNDQAIIDKAVKDIRDNIEREEGGLEWLHSALAKGDQVFQKFKDDEFKGTQEEVEGMKAKMDKADGIFEAHKEGMKKKEETMKEELEAIKKKMEEVEVGFVKEITQAGKLHREDVARLREEIQGMGSSEGGGKGGSGGRGFRPILESKAIGGIKNLDSGRDGFREWEEKFINVMGQAKEKADMLLEWLAREADAKPRDGGGYVFAREGKERALI